MTEGHGPGRCPLCFWQECPRSAGVGLAGHGWEGPELTLEERRWMWVGAGALPCIRSTSWT